MGGDGKSKEKKKKRMSPLSDPEDEGRSKRHRASGDDTKRSKLKESKEEKSSHSKSSHKHSERHSKKKSEGKHRNRHAKRDGHAKFELVELSVDDYYSKNNEFATWLKEERKLFFSDLSSEMARQLFSEFVKDWNHHKLGIKYYEGIAVGTRTAHKWKIKH